MPFERISKRPWTAEASYAHFWMVDSPEGTVAHGVHEGDARLIAEAPNLLACCRKLVTRLEREGLDNADLREAREVIARAEDL